MLELILELESASSVVVVVAVLDNCDFVGVLMIQTEGVACDCATSIHGIVDIVAVCVPESSDDIPKQSE